MRACLILVRLRAGAGAAQHTVCTRRTRGRTHNLNNAPSPPKKMGGEMDMPHASSSRNVAC
eukprot:SAG11_NODE_1155_length_5660_cov_6.290955_8_plen_61_part_00